MNTLTLPFFATKFSLSVLSLSALLLASCQQQSEDRSETPSEEKRASQEQTSEAGPKKPLSQEFKDYWYAGEAEITSYRLQQARYGETRDGKAVLIYVTEPFLPEIQVKADQSNAKNIPVLKLNATKNYLTGIYPYSIMTSCFYPVYDNQHALKISFSSQEWCGQVYTQLNNRSTFEVMSHSYFESEADQNLKLEKTILENELWNKVRIAPKDLPTGDFEVMPSLEYLRLSHKEIKAYAAKLSLKETNGVQVYTIAYPELQRTLEIRFSTEFPYPIEGWSETFTSGFGDQAKQMTSTATKMKTLKTPYWRQNSNKYLSLRDSLGL